MGTTSSPVSPAATATGGVAPERTTKPLMGPLPEVLSAVKVWASGAERKTAVAPTYRRLVAASKKSGTRPLPFAGPFAAREVTFQVTPPSVELYTSTRFEVIDR